MRDNQPTAYLMCGFIGAGKTTFAKKLERETKAIRITKDEWVIKVFGSKITLNKNFEKYDKYITELATQIALKILKSGKDVIIDEGFWVKSQRDDIKKNILKAGAKPILYYVECGMEEMKKRVMTRSTIESEDSFYINEKMFDGYVKYWEPPSKDEEFILVK